MQHLTPNLDYIPRPAATGTQQRILDCTLTTLAKNGYASTSIGEISRQLTISKGVIHYHFASREVLMQEAIAYIYTVARDYLSPRIQASGNAWEQLRTFIHVSCMFYQQYPVHIKALQEIRTNFQPKQYKSLAQTLYEQELTDLAAVFVAGQASGVFRSFDPDVAALTVRYALNGAVQRLSTQPSYDIHYHALELVELFSRAFHT